MRAASMAQWLAETRQERKEEEMGRTDSKGQQLFEKFFCRCSFLRMLEEDMGSSEVLEKERKKNVNVDLTDPRERGRVMIHQREIDYGQKH